LDYLLNSVPFMTIDFIHMVSMQKLVTSLPSPNGLPSFKEEISVPVESYLEGGVK